METNFTLSFLATFIVAVQLNLDESVVDPISAWLQISQESYNIQSKTFLYRYGRKSMQKYSFWHSFQLLSSCCALGDITRREGA